MTRNRTAPSLGSLASPPSLQINSKLLSASCVPHALYLNHTPLTSQGQGTPSQKNLSASLNLSLLQLPDEKADCFKPVANCSLESEKCLWKYL